MYKNFLFNISIIPFIISLFIGFNTKENIPTQPEEDYKSTTDKFENFIDDFYSDCNLQNNLSFDAFRYALIGYYNLECDGKIDKNKLLTVIDYSKSSNEKRLFVIDIEKKQIVLNSLVAHGRNTGEEFAQYFSNTPRSRKSSIGLFATGKSA